MILLRFCQEFEDHDNLKYMVHNELLMFVKLFLKVIK